MSAKQQKRMDGLYEKISNDPSISNPEEMIDALKDISFYINNFNHLKIPTSYGEAYSFVKSLSWGLLTAAPHIWNTYRLHSEGKFNQLFTNPYTFELLQLHNVNFRSFLNANIDFIAGMVQYKIGLPQEMVTQHVMPIFLPLLEAVDNDQTITDVNKLIMQFMNAQDKALLSDVLRNVFEIANNNEALAAHLNNPETHKHFFEIVYGLYVAAEANTDPNNVLLNRIKGLKQQLDSIGLTAERIKNLEPIFSEVLDKAVSNKALQAEIIGLLDNLTKPPLDMSKLTANLFGILQQNDLAKTLFAEQNRSLYAAVITDFLTSDVGGLPALINLGVQKKDVQNLQPIFNLFFEYLHNKSGVEDNELQKLLHEAFKRPMNFSKLNEQFFAFLADPRINAMLNAEQREAITNIAVAVGANNEFIKAKLQEHNIEPEDFKDLVKKTVEFSLVQVASHTKRSHMERLIDNVIHLSQKTTPIKKKKAYQANGLVLEDNVLLDNSKTAFAATAIEPEAAIKVTFEKFNDIKEVVDAVVNNVTNSKWSEKTVNPVSFFSRNREDEQVVEKPDLIDKILKGAVDASDNMRNGNNTKAVIVGAKIAGKLVELAESAEQVIGKNIHQYKEFMVDKVTDFVDKHVKNNALKSIINNNFDTVMYVMGVEKNFESGTKLVSAFNDGNLAGVIKHGIELISSPEVKHVIKTFFSFNRKSAYGTKQGKTDKMELFKEKSEATKIQQPPSGSETMHAAAVTAKTESTIAGEQALSRIKA